MIFTPNKKQKEAIYHPPAPLMIIAGAGTGKTSTLIYRIRHLIKSGVANPENIVILTFTEKATDKLVLKVNEKKDISTEGMVISTFHGFCNQLVRQFSDSPDAEKLLIQENDIRFMLLSRFDEMTSLTSHQFKANPISAVNASFIPFFNRIRDELLTPSEVQQKLDQINLSEENIFDHFPRLSDSTDPQEYIRQFNDLVGVYERYQLWKSDDGLVDYGDMILNCWKMLRYSSKILQEVRNLHQHFIIDEYQDNNYALNRIVNFIVKENPSITVVGDEDQCIYSFRGANYYNIKDFEERYSTHPDYHMTKLEENYRSSQEILDLANVSIANDANRTKKVLESAEKKHGPAPIWHVGDKTQTLSKIPELVQNYVHNEQRNYGDIAVICRSWRHVKNVATALQQALIPTDVFMERFFGIPIIKDLLAWGHILIDNPKGEAALFRLLVKYFEDHLAKRWYRQHKSQNLNDRIINLKKQLDNGQLSHDNNEKLKWLLTIREKLISKMRQKAQADEMIWNILKETDLLKSTRHSYRYAERLALINVGHLLSIGESFSSREKDKSLKAWLKYMGVLALDNALQAIQPNQEDFVSAVKVMTIHQSKGLEFPIVMIPFLRSGSFPRGYRKSSQTDSLPETWFHWKPPEGITPRVEYVNEERRVFYVAITRTIERLHLFGPKKYQSILMKELQPVVNKIIRRNDMTETVSKQKIDPKLELKQKLLIELNRELSARQFDSAKEIIDTLQMVDKEIKLPMDHPYIHLMDSPVSEEQQQKSPLSLSASSIEEYDTCPYKYRLNKIDRIPERKSIAQMEFGSIIHRVLEEYHGSEDQSLEYLLSLLDKHWKEDAFDYLIREEEFKRQGKGILTDYYHFARENPPDVLSREAKFDFIIDDLNVRISGKIDRIDMEKEGDRLTVTDYKTSKSISKAKSSLQLALYSEALHRDAVENIKGLPGEARLHFLRHSDDPIESYTFSTEDLLKHIQKVKKVADGIRKGEFKPRKGWHCDYCDYQDFLCPEFEEK